MEPNDQMCMAIVGRYLGHPVRCMLPEDSWVHTEEHEFVPPGLADLPGGRDS
jgi:hypothetical protein